MGWTERALLADTLSHVHVLMQTMHKYANPQAYAKKRRRDLEAKAEKERQALKRRLGLRSEWRRGKDGQWYWHEPERTYMSSTCLRCMQCIAPTAHMTTPYRIHSARARRALVHGQLRQLRALPAPPHHLPGRTFTIETAQCLLLSGSLHPSRDPIPVITPSQALLVRDLFITPRLLSPGSDMQALASTCKGTMVHTCNRYICLVNSMLRY